MKTSLAPSARRRFQINRKICDRRPPAPLGDSLLIDPVAFRKRPQAILIMLYRSTDRLCQRWFGLSEQFGAFR